MGLIPTPEETRAASIAPPPANNTPTVPTPVPTKAPTVSTSQPPASPTTVVSSQPAYDYINGKVVPTMQNAQTAIQTQNAARQSTTLAQDQTKASNQGKPGYDVLGNPIQTPTAEDTIANTPDAGNQWIYGSDGQRTQIALGAPMPPGYSTSDPTSPPNKSVADTTTDPSGNVYKQFSDGSYGKFDPTGQFIGAARAIDFQNSKQGEDTISKMNQLANGTYPLTANEQAQVDGLKAQFQNLIKDQQTANANYTGGVTVAQNLYGIGNTTVGLGNITGAINEGISKIADLNSKMNSAVASMIQSFQTEDLKSLKTAYDTYQGAVKERQDELDKMTAAAAKAKIDQQTQAREDAQLQLTAMMDDHTISYQDKEQALAQSSLDEKTKNDIANQQLEKLKYQLDLRKEKFSESQATGDGAIGGPPLPVVTMTGNNYPSKADQTKLLNSLPGGPHGDLATQIKGLTDYTINPTTFTVRNLKGATGLTRAQAITLAKQYDPTYDETQYTSRQSTRTAFQSGKYSQNITALNTAIGHISDIQNNFAKLGNAGFTPYNAAKNKVEQLFGAGGISSASLNLSAATGELATTFKNSGATDTEIKNLGTINSNSSPDQIKAYIETASQLLASRLGALEDTYTTGMGKAPDKSFLKPESQQALLKLQQNGLDIQVPQLADSPLVKLQTFHDASPDYAAMLQQLGQANPALARDPQAMIDYLDQQGISL